MMTHYKKHARQIQEDELEGGSGRQADLLRKPKESHPEKVDAGSSSPK
jgi:hypothetical protein